MRRLLSAVAAVLLATLVLSQPGCGGTHTAFTPGPLPQGELAARDGDFTLRNVQSDITYGAAGTYRLAVERNPAGALVSVYMRGADLRQSFLELQYDGRALHPVAGQAQQWESGGPDLLSLVVLDKPGIVYFGSTLQRPQERQGVSGEMQVLQVRFARGAFEAHTVSTAPRGLKSAITDLTVNESTGEINFSYFNQGDYNEDTLVNISDLTPLGVHFGQSTATPPFPLGDVKSVVDGDSNGVINISDITPIGANFLNDVSSWNVYSGAVADYPATASAGNGAATLVDSIDKTHLSANDSINRRTITFTTANTIAGAEAWVRPVGTDGEGIASNAVNLGLDTTPPVWTNPASPGVLAAAPHDGTVDVYWGEATDAQSPPVTYTVYYSPGALVDFATALTVTVPASVPFVNFEHTTVTGLTNGQMYTFAVRAKDSALPAANEEQNATEISTTPDVATEMPTTVTANQTFDTPMKISSGNTVTVTNSACIICNHDLTIDGTLHAQDGDLCLEVFGDLIVNGTINVDGPDTPRAPNSEWQNIKIICHGNYFFNSTSVVGGEANIYITDTNAAAAATTQQVVDDTDQDLNPGMYPFMIMPLQSGSSSMVRQHASAKPHAARNAPFGAFHGVLTGNWGVIPTPPVGVTRVVLNVQAKNGNLDVKNFSVTGPKGRKGTDDTSGNCTAHGGQGENAFRCRINVDGDLTFDNVTINLGDGGDGGDALAGPCDDAIAIGGGGGQPGKFRATGGGSIDVTGAFNLNPGKGGKGGMATALGNNGKNGCPCTKGGNGTATGGNGASVSMGLTVRGAVGGVGNVVLGPMRGGDGGDATATAGVGGNNSCCPAGAGCPGGVANSTGGDGGDASTTSLSGATGGGAIGGNGGQADATGGKGGNGASCDKFTAGGDGGPGGDATATAGQFGVATGVGPLTNGMRKPATALGGDGGNGGDGCPPGGAGAGGTATADGNPPLATNGSPGAPGADICAFLYCIPLTAIVPDPINPVLIPNGFTGTAPLINMVTSQQDGVIQFVWTKSPGGLIQWNPSGGGSITYQNADPTQHEYVTFDLGNINWTVSPKPTLAGCKVHVTQSLVGGTGTASGHEQSLTSTFTVQGQLDITALPPLTSQDFEFHDSFFDVFFRLDCEPQCTLTFDWLYIIDP